MLLDIGTLMHAYLFIWVSYLGFLFGVLIVGPILKIHLGYLLILAVAFYNIQHKVLVDI